MKSLLIAATLFLSSCTAVAPAYATSQCPVETSEERITEVITPSDNYRVLEGEELDLFIKNSNELYNIGWQREQIARVWVIDSEVKHPNEQFQPVHLFFIDTGGCIAYYQTTYSIVVDQLLDPDPTSHRPAPVPGD